MSEATLDNLLTQMSQNQEVLQGWDAVLNFLESALNDFLQAQWNQQTNHSGQMTVQAIWCDGVQPIAGQFFTNVTEITFVLGAPLFQFANGQSSVNVTQAIQSGSYRTGTLVVSANFNPATASLPYDDPSVDWSGPATSVTSGAHASISGKVDVQQVTGVVNVSPTARSLMLDFAQGAFTPNNLTISGVSNTDFSAQLQDWFATNKIQYLLFSVDFANHSGLPSLTPTAFQFAVITTNAGNNVVQLFITTDGSPQSNTTITVDEPIPTADNYTCSLMISSRILYNDIFAARFNSSNSTVQPQPPASPGQCWRAVVQFDLGNGVIASGAFFGSATSGFVLVAQGDDSFQPLLRISANSPVSLTGSGASQQLTITPGTPTVFVFTFPPAAQPIIEDVFTAIFRTFMASISFAPVSTFVLQNVLFPGNLIEMSQAQVPGDLLIAGTFSPN